jgi:hypothetical protein
LHRQGNPSSEKGFCKRWFAALELIILLSRSDKSIERAFFDGFARNEAGEKRRA